MVDLESTRRAKRLHEDTQDDYQAIYFHTRRDSVGIDNQQILSGSGKGLEIKSYST